MMKNANEYMKHQYLNFGERYEDMIDHRSYTHDLSSCEISCVYNCDHQSWRSSKRLLMVLKRKYIAILKFTWLENNWSSSKSVNKYLSFALLEREKGS